MKNTSLKKTRLILILICPIFLVAFEKEQAVLPPMSIMETGIVLDSMGNSISLAYENEKPAYYFSTIFTPVCNTGECLPVFINIYWNLNGRYLKFDQPAGEILTKLDHVPFTKEDYILLDEILRGPDPRFEKTGISYGSYGSESIASPFKENQLGAAPAQHMTYKVSKYDMVDGITGATEIQHQTKCVPGALYTTYTLWGLVNDYQQTIFNYTIGNLVTEENTLYLMTHPELGFQHHALKKMLAGVAGINAQAELLMGIIDTADATFARTLLNYIPKTDFARDTVSHTLERIFFRTTDINLKRGIIYCWIYRYCPEHLIPDILSTLSENQELVYEFSLLLSAKPHWLSAVLPDILNQMTVLTPDHQQYLLNYLELQKDYLSKVDLKRVKQAQKNYKP